MSFILSSVTKVSFGSNAVARGIISVQITAVPQIQRLAVLGSTLPFAEVRNQQNQVSIVRYGGGPTYNTLPSNSCQDSNTILFKFTPVGCNSEIVSKLTLNDNFFVSSYQFNKEINRVGQESWGLFDKPVVVFSSGNQFGSEEKVVVRGIADGRTTTEVNTGVVLNSTLQSEGISASITAGNPGIGNANKLLIGVATQIGGSDNTNSSEDGNGQVNIPYQVIDI